MSFGYSSAYSFSVVLSWVDFLHLALWSVLLTCNLVFNKNQREPLLKKENLKKKEKTKTKKENLCIHFLSYSSSVFFSPWTWPRNSTYIKCSWTPTGVPSVEGRFWDFAGLHLHQSRKGLQPKVKAIMGLMSRSLSTESQFCTTFCLKCKFISLPTFLAIHIGKDILLIVSWLLKIIFHKFWAIF